VSGKTPFPRRDFTGNSLLSGAYRKPRATLCVKVCSGSMNSARRRR
jgi:hypothetical protein